MQDPNCQQAIGGGAHPHTHQQPNDDAQDQQAGDAFSIESAET
jgi:hypothetical protein